MEMLIKLIQIHIQVDPTHVALHPEDESSPGSRPQRVLTALRLLWTSRSVIGQRKPQRKPLKSYNRTRSPYWKLVCDANKIHFNIQPVSHFCFCWKRFFPPISQVILQAYCPPELTDKKMYFQNIRHSMVNFWRKTPSKVYCKVELQYNH